jgi:predicted O-linked N-acetylglucosamine transferase (SPINDLY family)
MNDHPTAHMVEGLFAAHRARRCVHLAVFSYGKNDESAFRAEISAHAHAFHDVAALSHDECAAAIARAEVDILVDLQGHTLGGRPEVGARRAAPIQVSYLIFPGTSGAGWLDYLIADSAVAPAEHAAHYSEKLVLLPTTYQVSCFVPLHFVRMLLTI